ncbi:MAG: hypothetical protein ACON38_14415 [Akkermansiaceae bacterium]
MKSKYCCSAAILTSLMTSLLPVSAAVEEWFFVKSISYRQTIDNTAPTEAEGWYVEIAVLTTSPGDATSATISGGGIPGTLDLEWDDGEWLYGKDFESQAAMDSLFPSGQSYTITLSGGSLGTVSQTVALGPADYPAVPYLTGTNTGMTIPAGSLDPSISSFCYLEFARETTNTDGAGGFGVSGFSGRQSITFDFPFATRALDDGGLGDAAGTAGLAGEDALPTSEPFGDSVSNLLKFAFNMDLAGFDNGSLEPGSDSGLPTFELKDDGGETTFELNFIRRVDSPITYIPQRGDSLESFAPMAGTVTVTSIAGGEFERVTIAEPCDPAVVPKCFGRVLVIIP